MLAYRLIVADSVCIICGDNDAVRMLYPASMTVDQATAKIFSARRLPDRLHPEMMRCDQCGLVFPRRQADTALLKSLYEDSTYLYADLAPFITKNYIRAVRHALPSQQHHRLRAIDIGCGDGFMVKALFDEGFDAYGIEPSTDAIAKADPAIRSRIVRGLATSQTLGQGQYDLLTCFQTLDHMPDPVGFVRDCFSALKPGGTALFINHDIGSWTAKILGRNCPMIDVVHTYLHTPSTMRTLFKSAGFCDIAVDGARNDYPLWYWLHMVPFGARMKTACIRLLRSIGIGNIVLPLYAGNLCLIARRPT
jgi:SAM-dependent methyltransferase